MVKNLPIRPAQEIDLAMVSSEILVKRIEAILPSGSLTTKRMFGGITFLLKGNMLCCASKKGLMVRVGSDAETEALKSPYASLCLGAGRPMAGFIIIEPTGIAQDSELRSWVSMAYRYVETLPQKLQKRTPSNYSKVVQSMTINPVASSNRRKPK